MREAILSMRHVYLRSLNVHATTGLRRGTFAPRRLSPTRADRGVRSERWRTGAMRVYLWRSCRMWRGRADAAQRRLRIGLSATGLAVPA